MASKHTRDALETLGSLRISGGAIAGDSLHDFPPTAQPLILTVAGMADHYQKKNRNQCGQWSHFHILPSKIDKSLKANSAESFKIRNCGLGNFLFDSIFAIIIQKQRFFPNSNVAISMTTIGFIGAGQMAQALASGISSADSSIKFEIADPSQASQDAFCQKISAPIELRQNNAEIFPACDIVFLSIKPQYLNDAVDAKALQKALAKSKESPLIVSIMAGVTIERIAEVTGLKRIVRVMPNTPSLIKQGAAAIASSPEVTVEELKTVSKLMSAVGSVVTVSEELLDAVTGLSGSGPAYVFTFIEALIDGGVLKGLPRDIARQLAIQTVIGSAKLVEESGEHPAVLRDRVTSPGGTTIEALKVLEINDFRGTIIQAVESATRRSKELGTK